DRPVSTSTYRRVAAHMRWLGLDGYTQAVASSGESSIPEWDLLEKG
ncbi:MAG TPA: hypothetical protein IAC36_03810, partial [Candidatus Aphodomonas merdavium]|nr:hypothetical protein [Candidatus Aphodomonas merdavium]